MSAQILGRPRHAAPPHGLALLVLGMALLAGCGQKGPLFLPVPPVSSTAPARPATVPATPAAAVVPALPASAAR